VITSVTEWCLMAEVIWSSNPGLRFATTLTSTQIVVLALRYFRR